MSITRMKRERLKRKWTLKQVAEKVGSTKQTIQKIETLHLNPSYKMYLRLLKIFDIPYTDLLEQVEDENDGPFSSTN